MASFAIAVAITIEYEGGDLYTHDPDDPGGETRFGISKRAFPHVDIRKLTKPQAEQIYLEEYWNPIRGNSITSQALAEQVFDFAVNAGVSRSMKTLQGTINAIQREMDVSLVEDGVMGPKTLAATNRLCERHEDVVWTAFVLRRGRFYLGLDKKKYVRGWLRRLGLFVKGRAT